MKEYIETNSKFRFRLEDFMIIYFATFISFFCCLFLYFYFDVTHKIPFLGIIFLALIYILSYSLIIYLSYKKRIKYLYYIENDCFVKMSENQIIWQIPLSKIVSIRVYNKKEKEGSIIIYTNKESLDYWFSFFSFPVKTMMPISLFGFTKNKIDLVLDRKHLVTQIYLTNNKLNFI